MKLFFRQSGQGQPLIILHGLFGSSDNWYSIAKIFSENFTVYTVDQRNHGQSPHDENFDYKLLTEDLASFLVEQKIIMPVILGHSMGGKTAMNFAVKYAEKLSKLIVVDIAPKAYPIHHDHILEGMKAIPLQRIKSRNEADEALSEFVQEPAVRQFLLKNLSRADSGFTWKINLKAIDQHIEEISEGMQYPGKFEGPSLFIKGARSHYFAPGDEEQTSALFPKAKFVTLNTGHWVQAENPLDFSKTVLDFLLEH